MPNELYLRPDFAEALQAGAGDVYERLDSLPGQTVRSVARRRVFRVQLGDRAFFIKHHSGVGWLEILKNLVIGRLAVLDASNEVHAIERLSAAGVSTLRIAGYGWRGVNPATRESFVVTDELSDTVSLEMLTLNWPEQPAAVTRKRALIRALAVLTRTLHASGINHRDLYLCHVLLPDTPDAVEPMTLIDLHRAQQRERVPIRYRVRDLAGLAFSSADIGLTRADKLRFLSVYFDLGPRQLLDRHGWLLRKVEVRAAELYRKAERKGILSRQLYR